MINQNWQGIEPDPIALGSESARLNEAVVFGDTFAIIMKKNQPVPLLASDAIRESVGKACLTDLPWLSQKSRDEERAVFAEFEKKVGTKELKRLARLERKDKLPRGPGGSFWAKRECQYGEIYRPHRQDEVVVECCFPLWGKSASTRPYYVVVIASGPYGGIETVYINGQAFYYFGTESSEAIIPQWKFDLLTLLPQTLDIELAIKHYGVTSYGGIA